MNNSEAWKFLHGLSKFIDEHLARDPNLIQTIEQQVKDARDPLIRDTQGTWWEGAFLNYHIFPELNRYLVETREDFNEVRAKRALLLEGDAHHRKISCVSQASPVVHPDTKCGGASPV